MSNSAGPAQRAAGVVVPVWLALGLGSFALFLYVAQPRGTINSLLLLGSGVAGLLLVALVPSPRIRVTALAAIAIALGLLGLTSSLFFVLVPLAGLAAVAADRQMKATARTTGGQTARTWALVGIAFGLAVLAAAVVAPKIPLH